MDEPVAERVLRETPNESPDDIDLRDADRGYDDLEAGEERIVEPGSEDVDRYDTEKDAVGRGVREGESAMSAEESALHVTDRP